MAQVNQAAGMSGSLWIVPLLDALCALILVLLLLVNPPTQAQDTSSPGTVMVEARWPDECDTDVDLWTLAPNDQPVGYSAPSGRVFNLLRDDLGNTSDLSHLNYENAYTRGAPTGDYAVTAHLYHHRGGCPLPVPVDIQVSLKPEHGVPRVLANKRVTLGRIGEEATAARFRLGDRGELVGDVYDIPIILRETR